MYWCLKELNVQRYSNLTPFLVSTPTFLMFQHLLPLNIISSSSIKVVYNSIDFKEGTNFGYKAEYKFHNEETCGTRRISTQIGNLIMRKTH